MAIRWPSSRRKRLRLILSAADIKRNSMRMALEKAFGHRPVIFYTNGFDIWIWDDFQGFPPRKLFGFYSKDSLQYLANFQRVGRKPLDTIEINEVIVNRLYQIEAIKRISERFSNKHRKALVVQATGTGKTRVAIALADLLIRAGWVKRVLFLCDRRELRKQAKNAFNDFLSEPIRIVTSRVKHDANERIFLATYPAMQKVFQSFDVGFFDLIIADESHRSIYNVYGDIFHYFDCHQIGLTATPVDFLTRSTFKLFDCEGQLPTANYDLEQAVAEGYLTPFEVFEHTTQFLREGISLDTLTKDQIEELEEQGEDPVPIRLCIRAGRQGHLQQRYQPLHFAQSDGERTAGRHSSATRKDHRFCAQSSACHFAASAL